MVELNVKGAKESEDKILSLEVFEYSMPINYYDKTILGSHMLLWQA
jgi:hypothetical protein